METVFHASLALDAHLVRDLLERADIPARIEGEYLQGAGGELPLGGLVRVVVAPEHATEAREVIAEWEKRQPAEPRPASSRKVSWAPFTFILGGALGLFAGWFHFNTPITEDGVDYDNDGKLDERFFYNGQKTSKVETDRNADGHVDARFTYDSRGLIQESFTDDDFDRRFEQRHQMLRGQPQVTEIDADGDGFVEETIRYQHGVGSEVEYRSPATRAVIKRTTLRAGWPVSAQFDADGDGTFERSVEYDEMGDPRP